MSRAPFRSRPFLCLPLLAALAAPCFGGEAEDTDLMVQQLRRIVDLRRQVAEITKKRERMGLIRGGRSVDAAVAHIDAEVRLAERLEALRAGLAPLPRAEAERLARNDPIAKRLRQMAEVCREHAAMSEARHKAGVDTQVPVLQARVGEAEAMVRLARRAETVRGRHFLRLADDAEVKYERGQIAGITRITAVKEATVADYEQAKLKNKIKAEQRRGDWLYYAVEEGRDAPFANANAWVFITERYKVRLPDAPPKPQDNVLTKAFADLLTEDFATKVRDEGNFDPKFIEIDPKSIRIDPKSMAECVRRVGIVFPTVLRVTPEQHKRFAAGQFDDAANRRAMAGLIQKLEALGAELPVLAQTVVQKHQAGELRGAKLEVGRRFLEAIVKRAAPRGDGG